MWSQCTVKTQKQFVTVHHEMGHIQNYNSMRFWRTRKIWAGLIIRRIPFLKNKHTNHWIRPIKDIEVPLEKQSKRLQARFIKFFDSFIHYKNERTMVACTENSMQLMFQLSLSYHELLFTDPRNLRKPFHSFWRSKFGLFLSLNEMSNGWKDLLIIIPAISHQLYGCFH